MKLWLISQTENDDYDTYDSAVVAAADEPSARLIIPGGGKFGDEWNGWCRTPEAVHVQLIGTAEADVDEGVVLASFNAG